MKEERNIIILGSILIVLFILFIILSFIPKLEIKLNGSSKINVEVGSEYKELGATAYITKLGSKDPKKVKIEGSVDSTKLGEYIIIYQVESNNIKKQIKRTVKVVDKIPPEIILNKEIKACKNNNIIDIDIKAVDNYDGDISENVKYRIEDKFIYISVVDSSNNKTEIKENINYIDDIPPRLTLNGNESIYIKIGDKYEEYGAKAIDSCDCDLTQNIEIENYVDIQKVGTYKVIYKVKDKNNNESKISRKVFVVNEQDKIPTVNNGIIYLTFDDGPGIYTEEFLNVLEKYNVKATFFVTNQFPKYQSLIKKEYELGHTVGIHTYSHKWSIYRSVDTYLEDFNEIEQIIFEQTGAHPSIFRFPGGSSNTVSRQYSKGIMTKLSKVMTEKNYLYFDWTFDSGDTSKNRNSKEDIIKTVKENLKGDGEYIILMHDLKKNTLDALPEIIEYAKSVGYEFKPITTDTYPEHFKIAN